MPGVISSRLLKLAMPLTTFTAVVLPVAKLPGPLATLSVTVSLLSLAITLPNASCTSTITVGRTTPVGVLAGGAEKASLAAAAGVTIKGVAVLPVKPAAAAVIVYVPACFTLARKKPNPAPFNVTVVGKVLELLGGLIVAVRLLGPL